MRDKIAQTIREEVGSIGGRTVTVETHGGYFGESELMRVSGRTPAVFVSALGLPKTTRRGGSLACAQVQWGAFVIVEGGEIPRDEAAVALVEKLIVLLLDQTWGYERTEGQPKGVAAKNLFTSGLDRKGVSIWAIRWSQGVTIEDLTLDDLADFERLRNEYNMDNGVDRIDATDNVEIPQND